jgi:predicted O-linked N-acetylglucosamine transferase (SPINDLY family)
MPLLTPEQLLQAGFEHHRAGRIDEAQKAYRQVLAIQPRNADAIHLLALLEQQANRHQRAFELLTAAIAIDPSPAEFHYNLGNSLLHLKRTAAATEAFAAALARNPDFFEARRNLGAALMFENRANEAADVFLAAARQRPDSPDVQNNLGMALKDLGRVDEAVECFRRAIELQPNYRGAWDNFLYALLYHPGYDAAAIFREHAAWASAMTQALTPRDVKFENDRLPDRRLRVAYVSPNFREHPVGRALLPLLEQHDREQFEVVCYADADASPNDPVAQRLRRCADQWHATARLDDAKLADLVREHRVDLLVDITLHMTGSRLLAFARRPAPVQLTFIGYPATTGLPAIDYRITDPWLDPPGGDSDSANVEKLVRLPRSFWCYDAGDEQPVSELPARSRDDGRITFGSLNNAAKVSPPVIDTWAEILTRVPSSRLMLFANERVNPGEHLRGEFHRRGIAPDRLEFLPRVPRRDYLKQYGHIDIALDPWPYNGHMTSCDALWMGVPVVSLIGQTSVARAGASLLTSIGLTELLAPSRDQYVDIAVTLANDANRLASLRGSMRQRMKTSPLTDAKSFARDVESIYRELWRRWCGAPTTAA